MMCAGYDNGVLDACQASILVTIYSLRIFIQGDSGGPMVWKGESDNFYTQIGSYGAKQLTEPN